MPTFDKSYYDVIWPESGIHRHDYCEFLANRLIQQYGKVRFLDIGTGCGYLVKVLRDKGCEAWGLECSEYALASSDAPQWVRLGDVRNIPFPSGYFDVVHSQGLWGYFPEEDIQAAWRECQRVGKKQDHTIDYEVPPPQHQYLYTHTPQWWKDQFYPRILIVTPTTIHKGYSMEKWLANVRSFTYPNYDIFVVDGSPTEEFYNKWKSEVPMQHLDTSTHETHKVLQINNSFEACRQHFLMGSYARMMTLESDIIPPHNIIEFLFEWGRDADWISHSFPNRQSQITVEQGLGVCLFSRRFLEKYGWGDFADNYTSDGGLWAKCKDDRDFVTIEIWNKLDIVHLQS